MEVDDNAELNNNDEEFITFLRTILMILKNHKFKDTVTIFTNECDKLGYKEIDATFNKQPMDQKSPTKIVFENFTKHEPCRIIIENYDEQILITNNVENNKSKIKKSEQTSSKIEENVDEEEIISKEYINLEKDNNYSDKRDIVKPVLPNNSAENINDNKESKKDCSLGNLKDEFSEENIFGVTIDKDKDVSVITSGQNNSHKLNTSKIEEYDVLKNKFSILQVEHQKLMDVVTELTFALQTSIKGEIEDTHNILNNCERIYPELFCNKAVKSNTILMAQNAEVIPAKEIKSNNEYVKNDLKSSYKPMRISCLNLDFQKIKHDLKNGDLETKLLLLQALRWRITKSPDIIREHIIKTYIRYDILNVHCCSHRTGLTYPKNSIVFTCFYCSCKSPQTLQQSVTRFVNAMASLKTGRDYIIHQSVILNILLSVLLGNHPSTPDIDDVSRDMIVAILQKISLRYSSRMVMISDGLTEYITKFLLNNYSKLNEYCLEYSIALLRNLWLHSESREKCHPIAHDVMKLLANLLDEQYTFCLPYITASLYNLLPDNYFHKSAENINLDEIIKNRIEKLDGEMRDQLQYILEIFLNPDHWQPLCECDLGTDAENEMDIIEPEIDLNESIINANSNGEQFLYNYRRTYSNDGADISPYYINNIFSSPVTPNIANIPIPTKENKNPSSKQIPEMDYLEFLNEHITKKTINITGTECKEVQTNDESHKIKEENKQTEIELTFSEETQQLYLVPSKTRIFEPDKTYNLRTFSPTFVKNIGGYDVKNISKSLPVSARNKNLDKTSELDTNEMALTQFLTPTANFSGICYREGFKPRSYSDSSSPHIGFCFEESKLDTYSKYSCACFAEMQRSIDDDPRKKNNNEKANLSIRNEISENMSTNFCKYKCYTTSNSAPIKTAPKMERDTGTSKSLDESDCTAVFESRPRVLRTP